ncbi:MAG: SPFH domain-containing protein, partial [Acidobacteriota bacterium]
WRDLVRPALRYGFGDLLDDLAFWLVVGIGLAGVLTALLPDNLDELGLGTGLLPMIALLVVGIPLYMCASASTPIAAALLLKGVSPGAALVFLLAGPATNAATVLQLAATFGRRFVQIYVISVAAGALAAGLLLDLLLGDLDVTEGLRLAADAAPGGLSILMALALAGLLIRSLLRGSWAAGVGELRQAGQRLQAHLPSTGRLGRRHLVAAGLLLLVVVYAGTGLQVVPPGERGFGFVFGALVRSDVEPGLHYLPPAPFGRWEVRRVDYPRKTDVGFRTDLSLVQQRRFLTLQASQGEWHSPVAAMNSIPSQATYLTGDGNLVEVSFSVHYTLSDAEAFFYRIDHSRDFVNLYAEAVARQLIAGLPLDELLTERRSEVEDRLLRNLQQALDEQDFGLGVLAVRIVDLHPPGAAVYAFRDVSSAKEDRETAIHRAREDLAQRVPRGRGEAAKRVAEAEAEADRKRQAAQGESQAFVARAAPYGAHRELLGHLLWIEATERALAGREKVILPPGRSPSASRSITLWPDNRPAFPTFPESER